MKITELTLQSTNPITMESFYTELFGLKILKKSVDEISFSLKNSKLKFVQNSNATPYHFAFTIASNKIVQAHGWLKSRVKILKHKEKDIVDFPAWNAESIYFHDPDQNIVEFIVRKNLDFPSKGEFSSNDIIEISEIGIATENFTEKLNQITSIPNVEKFFGDDKIFCAIGSERGLFILIDKNKKDWFPSHDKSFSSAFSAIIKLQNQKFRVQFKNDILNYDYF